MRSCESVVNQIQELFKENNLHDGWTYDYFKQCLRNNKLGDFYVDNRVKFNGRRKLNALIDELKEIKNR